jgi:hypothetical protein
MAVLCTHCASPKTHRSHRYGWDFVTSALFGYFPYRCSACNSRFRAKKEAAPVEPPAPPDVETPVPVEEGSKAHRSSRSRHRSKPRVSKKKSKPAIFREVLLYALALAAFLAFLHWISVDHSTPPPGT